MSKRFVDSEIFGQEWFRKLHTKDKVLFFYLLTNCDIAGVISPDWPIISQQIGGTVTENDLWKLNENIVKLKPGKYFIRRFIEYQYGLDFPSGKSNVHKGVLKCLASHRLGWPVAIPEQENNSLPSTLPSRLPSSFQDQEP